MPSIGFRLVWSVLLLALAAHAGEAEPDPAPVPMLEIGRRDEAPPAPCETCRSSGRMPLKTFKPYVLMEGDDDPPGPEQMLGWSPCPDCALGPKQQAAFEAEMKRQLERRKDYDAFERRMKLAFVDFETRHASGHFQASAAEAREVAFLLDRLDAELRAHLGAEFFGELGPRDLRLLVVENEKAYLQGLGYVRDALNHQSDDPNWYDLAKSAGAFGTRNMTLMRRDLLVPPAGAGLPHMAVFAWARMLIRHLGDGKTPRWFEEGFASLGENLVLGSQQCYSIAYEFNKVDFEPDWNKAAAEAVRQNKAKPWKVLFEADMISMPPLDYQCLFSIVRYLYKRDGAAFAKLVTQFRIGKTAPQALEQAFGVPPEKLELDWKVWVKSGR